jgi:hypothetical protein
MSEAPVAQPTRPGAVSIAITAVLTVLFAIRSVLWWIAVYAGTTTFGDMTAWQWLKVGFYHVAVVAGLAGLIEMLRARARPSEASAAEQPPLSPP